MTDKKISQLSNATTPLAGTEVLPIVQSGSTVKVSVANLTAGRTVDATTVNATTVDATNIEVTNVKAKDGTAAIAIADSTGAVTVSSGSTLNGGTVINELGADADTRIEGDTDANLFFADASADKIGVGTDAPVAKFETYDSAVNGAFVAGTPSTWRVAQIRNDQTGTSNTAAGISFIGTTGTSPAGIVAIHGNTTGGVISLAFLTVDSNATVERMRIASDGKIGVGKTPDVLFDVNGVSRGGLTNRKGSYTPGDTTPSAAGVSYLNITNSSATSITAFTGGVEGQLLLLLFNDANTTITRNNAFLAGSTNFTSANRATLLLMSDGTNWYEVCRSTTNG